MKKNLHISLLFLITVFTVLSYDTSDQNQSFQQANELEKNQRCDIVICLSCPEFTNKNNSLVHDKILAKELNPIGRIIGKSTHNFFENPISCKNRKGEDMIVNQVGGTGVVLIRPDFEFTKFSGKKLAKSHTISVSQKTDG